MNLKIEYDGSLDDPERGHWSNAFLVNADDQGKLVATVHGTYGDPRPLAALFAAAEKMKVALMLALEAMDRGADLALSYKSYSVLEHIELASVQARAAIIAADSKPEGGVP